MLRKFKANAESEQLQFTVSSIGKNGKPGYELNLQASTKEEMMQFVLNLQLIAKDFQKKEADDFQDNRSITISSPVKLPDTVPHSP